jgi:7,8-dihydropterin-6-yl-methyl-4-(beta-D-ribofuranosyl)aminobenzene 5'-phosphate synthase
VVDWRRAWEASRVEPVPLEAVDSLSITTLVDNTFDALLVDSGPAKRPGFGDLARRPAALLEGGALDAPVAEHGFSALVSMKRGARTHQLLFDAGVSPDGAINNMGRLGLRPADVEAVVLSHGHFDHTTGLDGLARALGRPSRLPVVLHPGAFARRRLAIPGRDPFELPTLTKAAVAAGGFELLETPTPSFLFGGSLLVTGEVDRTSAFEAGMPLVHQAWNGSTWEHDPLVVDDQALIANVRGKGLVVLTGCGHSGIVNLVRYAQRLTGIDQVHAIVGGLHLNGPFFEPAIPRVVQELAAVAPDVVVPAHCTGFRATAALQAGLPEAFIVNSVGTRLQLTAA